MNIDNILKNYEESHRTKFFEPLTQAASSMMYIDPQTGLPMISNLHIEVGIYMQRDKGHIIEVIEATINDCQNTLIYYTFGPNDEPRSIIANDFDWYKEFERVGEV